MSASNRARFVQRETGLPYTTALKLVTGQRQILPRVDDCLYQDALDKLAAQTILRRWAQRTNQVLPAVVLEGDRYVLELPTVKGTGRTPARASWDAAQQLMKLDTTLGQLPTTAATPEVRLPCDCARCDP